MRRLVETVIIEAFESKKIANKIKSGQGDFQLSTLVGLAISEPSFSLSRNSKKMLPQLRDIGHLSAHGRAFFATRPDIEKVQLPCRGVVEEFLRIAGLL